MYTIVWYHVHSIKSSVNWSTSAPTLNIDAYVIHVCAC